MNETLEHIVVVGGGSAGWLVASVLAAETRLRVTLVESPGVAPIGVGEGTWPTMRNTLTRIGVSEADFFRECDVAFKQGSRFDRWTTGKDGDHYFHPFMAPQGYGEANLVKRWMERFPEAPFAEVICCQPALCLEGRAPKQPQTPEFAGVANYGYHLDAGKFGMFLQRHATARLGVRHVQAHVEQIVVRKEGAYAGDIAAIDTREHGRIEGDLFIDCTGMKSLLLGEHYGVPLVSQKHVLFNDCALAVQVRYPAEDTPISSQTTSTAQRAGWIWDIGLPTRRGLGHVYSSAHSSDEEAERDLLAYIAASGGGEPLAAPRKIAFDPGFRERFWHRNCLAIGLSSGFIEPLEASALALIELSVGWLVDDMPATRAQMDVVAERFNEAFLYRWQRVIDFLKLHYVLSKREDSAYWNDHRRADTIPERLRKQLTLWRSRAPSFRDFPTLEEVFPAASYEFVLYGMGFRSEIAERATDRPQVADRHIQEAGRLAARMLSALPSNRELLDHIRTQGMPRG